MQTIAPETRIIDLTVAQLLDLIRSQQAEPALKTEEPTTVYGLAGLATIFNCSMRTASRIMSSGKIDRAVHHIGKRLTIDVELAKKLMYNN